MKLTLDLPDDLVIEAKTVAALRKTTLSALVESALRSEIQLAAETVTLRPDPFEDGPHGFLRLKRQPGERISEEQLKAIADELSDEDMRRAIHPREA